MANLKTVNKDTSIPAAQGDILYFNGTSWVSLPANSDGYVLTTHNTGSNPTWAPAVGGGSAGTYTQLLAMVASNESYPTIPSIPSTWSVVHSTTGTKVVLWLNCSAIPNTGVGITILVELKIDGVTVATAKRFMHDTGKHQTLIEAKYYGTLAAGSHTFSVSSSNGATDSSDFADLLLLDIP